MPPRLLYDITGIDLNQVIFDQEAIRLRNPQRGDMEHLDAIVWVNPELGRIIGYKDVRADEFWAPGHIPGRPLLPGVLMIEAAAQLCSFHTREYEKWTGFIGFGGAEDIRFRIPVVPGQRLYIIAQKSWIRHGRFACKTQGLVDGQIAFEASIIGSQV
jgi:3-hydroxyacyl-[acyl-carrier-protein] dehydratase